MTSNSASPPVRHKTLRSVLQHTVISEQDRFLQQQWRSFGLAVGLAAVVGVGYFFYRRSGSQHPRSGQDALNLLFLGHIMRSDANAVASALAAGANVNCFDRLPILLACSLPLTDGSAQVLEILLANGAEWRIPHCPPGLSASSHFFYCFARNFTVVPSHIRQAVQTSGWFSRADPTAASLPAHRLIQLAQQRNCHSVRNPAVRKALQASLTAIVDGSCGRSGATLVGGRLGLLPDNFNARFDINQTDTCFPASGATSGHFATTVGIESSKLPSPELLLPLNPSRRKGVGTLLHLCCDAETASEEFTALTLPILLTHDEVDVLARRGQALSVLNSRPQTETGESLAKRHGDSDYDIVGGDVGNFSLPPYSQRGPVDGDGLTALHLLCVRLAHASDAAAMATLIKRVVPLCNPPRSAVDSERALLSGNPTDRLVGTINTPDAAGFNALYYLLLPLLVTPRTTNRSGAKGRSDSNGASSPKKGDPLLNAENLRRVVEVAQCLVDAGCDAKQGGKTCKSRQNTSVGEEAAVESPVTLAQQFLAWSESESESDPHITAARDLCTVLLSAGDYHVVGNRK